MKKFLPRRPSASMLVALTALVVAMSGTAIAAGLVNGDKLIRKHSLSGNRLRNHTITGTQVNLNKLGKVPSAKNADHATSANSATTAATATAAITAGAATNAVNATNANHASTVSNLTPIELQRVTATDGSSQTAAEAAAPQVPLYSKGVLSIYGKCFRDTSTNTVYGEVYIATTQAGAFFSTDNTNDGVSSSSTPAFISPGDTESSRALYSGTGYDAATANTASFPDPDDTPQFYAIGPDGTAISGTLQFAEKNGSLTGSQGPFGSGNVCLFWGNVLG